MLILINCKYLDKSFSIEDLRGFGNFGGLKPRRSNAGKLMAKYLKNQD